MKSCFAFVALMTAGLVGICLLPDSLVMKAGAQIYADGGVSNYPGGGWVIGQILVPHTNNAGTNFNLTAKPQPIGFYGGHSATQRTVTVSTSGVDNVATTLQSLLNALASCNLIKTN